MKVAERFLDNGRRELEVTLGPAEWEVALDGFAFSEGQDEAKRILFENVGREVLDDVFPSPVTVPIMMAKRDFAKGERFTFSISYLPAIRLELDSLPQFDVSVRDVTIGDAEVDDEIRRLVQENPIMRGRIPGTIVDEGSSVEMYLRAEKDGKVFPGLCGQREYTLGEGFLPDEFDRRLIGARAGDKIQFPFKLQQAEGEEPVDISVHIDVHKVYENDLNSVSNEWVQFNFPGFKDIGELRDAIQREMTDYIEQRVASMKLEQAVDQIYLAMQSPLPDEYLAALHDEARRVLLASLEAEGISYGDYLKSAGKSRDDFEFEMLLDVRSKAVSNAVLDALAAYLGLEVADEERESFTESLASQLEREGSSLGNVPLYKSAIDEAILRQKATERLLELVG